MTQVTLILQQIERGEAVAAERLLPLVYDELRRLAAARIEAEAKGQTLQATDLVHQAYLRLVATDDPPHGDGRGHFFAAAAEAMRRILVENARRKQRLKHGGDRKRLDWEATASMVEEITKTSSNSTRPSASWRPKTRRRRSWSSSASSPA